jgi:hypothetical protein
VWPIAGKLTGLEVKLYRGYLLNLEVVPVLIALVFIEPIILPSVHGLDMGDVPKSIL